ncbi:hypothetical protein EGJ22_01330 [Pseudomonas sp. p99-361]|nr:hypothetical protein HV87_22290 [Pseudomonas aeruginosa]PYC03859.1 hypothetical protein DMX12_09670 [Pseudomonas sp. MB-090624]QDR68768.1 hypothetical protein FPB55_14595 [Pseudomonas sp. BJP69]QEQ88407.1 hypothetical protein F1602_14265 [Pseudomonas putida]QKL02394.1 hypothetical protein GEV39_13775 [Pseudomonas sp. NY5710]RRV23972.1 hypothetical protein EGJ22_01330 [Pseudomonas sp. p99-361]
MAGVPCCLEGIQCQTGRKTCHSLWHDRLFAGRVAASISLYGMVSFAFDYRTKPVLANCQSTGPWST